MKVRPIKFINGIPKQCSPDEATHLVIKFPSPAEWLTLPVTNGGWEWNKSVDAPTLTPSILTKNHLFVCHSYIIDGKVNFLSDCTHDLKNKTVELEDLDDNPDI